MTDDMPSFRDMFHTAQKDGLYNMHKEVDRFVKGNLLPDGTYENRVTGGPLGDRLLIFPGEMAYEKNGNIVDPMMSAVSQEAQPNGSGWNIAMTPEKQAANEQAVDNINQNNEELGLKSKSQEPVERIASGVKAE